MKGFYEEQNDFIDELVATDHVRDHVLRSPGRLDGRERSLNAPLLDLEQQVDDTHPQARSAAFLMNLSLGVNVCLCILKVSMVEFPRTPEAPHCHPTDVNRMRQTLATSFLQTLQIAVVILSGSMAVLASALDSVLDILSGLILWVTSKSARKVNKYRYPVGKRRIQPLGIIAFACVMGTMSLYVILESIISLFGGRNTKLSSVRCCPAVPLALSNVTYGWSGMSGEGAVLLCTTHESRLLDPRSN